MANAFVGLYAAALNRHGGLRGAVRRYGLVRLFDAMLRAGWEALGMRILRLLGRRPERGYGWFEALLAPTGDYWFRYAEVIAALNALSPARKARLIEVASGSSGGMAWALGRQDSGICLVDRSADLLQDTRGRGALRVCADGCRLPFRDNAFDAAVSLDTVEHLPRPARPQFIRELKRVAKRGVVVSCPTESADDLFQAQRSDTRLSAVIAKRNGMPPAWLVEHLQQEHPTRADLSEMLPGAKVTGSENCDAWLRYALVRQRPFMWLFSGLFYLLFLRKHNTKPPYRQALVLWRKGAGAADPARMEFESATSQVTSA